MGVLTGIEGLSPEARAYWLGLPAQQAQGLGKEKENVAVDTFRAPSTKRIIERPFSMLPNSSEPFGGRKPSSGGNFVDRPFQGK